MHNNRFWIDGTWTANASRNEFDKMVLSCIEAIEQDTSVTGNNMTVIEREVRRALMSAMHATAKKSARGNDEAREQLAAANAELARIREWMALQNLCGKTAREMVYEYTGLVAGHHAAVAEARRYVMNANARIEQFESALRFYAENPSMGEIARAALAGVEPATRGE